MVILIFTFIDAVNLCFILRKSCLCIFIKTTGFKGLETHLYYRLDYIKLCCLYVRNTNN